MIGMILLMLLQTAMLAFSQVALKLAMKGLTWEWSWSFIWHHVLTNAWLMFAIFLMIAANLFWLWLLNKYPFSQIYPLTSLGFIFGILAGLFIFHEQVGYMQWIGVAMVITGCMFIAKI
jgi:undecaprenyl phosphate-alpha-L-ara4N flippase subunit ArnE